MTRSQLEQKLEQSDSLLDRVCERFHSQFPAYSTRVYITWKSSDHDEINKIEVEIKDLEIVHYIWMSGGSTIDEWGVDHPYERSWEGIAKAYETRPKIMKALGEIDADLPIEIDWCDGHHGDVII